MTDHEFLELTITVFILVVAFTATGFTLFLRWRKNVLQTPNSREQMELRASRIDARYRRKHPEIDEDFEDAPKDSRADS